MLYSTLVFGTNVIVNAVWRTRASTQSVWLKSDPASPDLKYAARRPGVRAGSMAEQWGQNDGGEYATCLIVLPPLFCHRRSA